MKHPWSSQHFREGARRENRSAQLIEAVETAAAKIKQANPDLPVVLTLNHLAHLTDVSSDDLQRVAFRLEDPYRVFRVRKRGKSDLIPAPARRYRTICVPHPFLMRTQRWIAQNILNAIEPHPASFAFAPKRDLVDAAERHVGANWLLKMDVRHFFESILERQVYWVFRSLGYGALMSFQLARICTRLPDPRKRSFPSQAIRQTSPTYQPRRQGHLPQGAPTSPMLANLTMRSLDARLSSIANGEGWTYTRYADDLAFSRIGSATRKTAMHLAKRIEQELERVGLTNHREKASIAPPGARKVLLGLLIDRDRPRLTHAFRNNLETHLFALTNRKIGPLAHRQKRGFASVIGMRRHIEGLIAFAHRVDPQYAKGLYAQLNSVIWP